MKKCKKKFFKIFNTNDTIIGFNKILGNDISVTRTLT